MLDRAIGIIGLAFALIFGLWSLAPDGWPKVPPLAIISGTGFGIFLVGVALGLLLSARRITKLDEIPKIIETNLFLQFSETHTIPIEKLARNIKYWYALFTESIYVDTKDTNGNSIGGFSVPPRWAIFIIFEQRPFFRQLTACGQGPNNPKCDVQTANADYAIFTITGDVTNSTFDIGLTR